MPRKVKTSAPAEPAPMFTTKQLSKTPFWLQTIKGPDLTLQQKEATWSIHKECFPEVQETEETLEQYMQKATFLHNPDDCIWLILWKEDMAGAVDPQKPEKIPVGMATVAAYTDSLYVFNMGVIPEERKQGLGERLLREAQQLALQLDLHKLSGSVDTSKRRLISFYRKLGAKMVSGSYITSGKKAPPSVRLEAGIHPGRAKVDLQRCDRRIAGQLAERSRTALVLNAAGVSAVALLGTLLLAKLFSNVLRPRGL